LTSLAEEGLTLVLERPRRERVVLPVSTAGGGMLPDVDLNSNAALLDLLDQP
jgi:hypothetical protein